MCKPTETNDTEAILKPGDLVNYIASTRNYLRSGGSVYNRAVVVSLDPFELISESGDMYWTATVKIGDFEKVGEASREALIAVMGRVRSELHAANENASKLMDLYREAVAAPEEKVTKE